MSALHDPGEQLNGPGQLWMPRSYIWTSLSLFPLEYGGQAAYMETIPQGLIGYRLTQFPNVLVLSCPTWPWQVFDRRFPPLVYAHADHPQARPGGDDDLVAAQVAEF